MLTAIDFNSVSALIAEEKKNGRNEFRVTGTDGKVNRMRLFLSSGGNIAFFKPHSRRHGYVLNLDAVSAVHPVQHREVSFEDQFRKNAHKLFDILTASGLWANISRQIQDAEFEYDKFTESGKRNTEFAREIADWNVKRMDFRRISDGDSVNEYYRAEILRSMTNGENYRTGRISGRKYDVSFQLDNGHTENNSDGIKRAWYSEEYRGCGNGHYYLAIDHERAIYYEKD